MQRRRVVVTGLGILSPIGNSVADAWASITAGRSGIGRLEGTEYAALPCRVAGIVRSGDPADVNSSGQRERIRLDRYFTRTELKSISPATAYALIASQEALRNAGLDDAQEKLSEEQKMEIGVAVGMGMVDLQDICNTNDALNKSYKQVSPFFVPRILANMASGQISIKYGFRGPNHSVSTACATGAHAIGDSFRFIRNGDAQAMVCGGTEACISPLAIAAFCRLRALSTAFNDTPEQASRPFDRSRDGFVMGEGSAILVLEELEHARKRNAHIHAEIIGYGLSGDGSHLTAPRADGAGAIMAMRRALKDANIDPEDVGYVNAHATSTPLGDNIEARAIHSVFGAKCAVSSTKGAHGHLLGGAGNLETIFAIKAVEEGELPPTVNLLDADEPILNYVQNGPSRKWSPSPNQIRRVAVKNAFGFGGTNASLCITQYIE